MILIIGGAYQGKLDYAKRKFGISEDDIFCCSRDKAEIDFGRRVILHLDEFVYACTAAGKDSRRYLAENRSRWENSIIILNDVSCGLVPMEPLDRAYREAVGRTAVYLGKEARSAVRVFAGLAKNLK